MGLPGDTAPAVDTTVLSTSASLRPLGLHLADRWSQQKNQQQNQDHAGQCRKGRLPWMPMEIGLATGFVCKPSAHKTSFGPKGWSCWEFLTGAYLPSPVLILKNDLESFRDKDYLGG
jgi:hypothetical protein